MTDETTAAAVAAEVTMTERAAEKAQAMIDNRGVPGTMIRIGVSTSGCSGMSYKLEYADAAEEGDKVFECHGIKIVVDPKSMLYIAGTEVDYVTEQFKSGFKFTNPQEKAACGCGESFSV